MHINLFHLEGQLGLPGWKGGRRHRDSCYVSCGCRGKYVKIWEDVTGGGITLEVTEMSEYEVLDEDPYSFWGEGEQEQNYGTQRRCG